MHVNPADDTLRRLLQETETIAVVGLSDKPDRDSFRVARYMQKKGYRIIPVNPRLQKVLGENCYPDLSSIPERVDIVNIFRRSDQVPPVVKEALSLKPRAVWLQLGISSDEAADMVSGTGITMVMDRCIKVEHARLLGRPETEKP